MGNTYLREEDNFSENNSKRQSESLNPEKYQVAYESEYKQSF
jgi:hypothetical protein